ncbi:MAG TPA: VWA domain-containing protein [Rhodocyclaceae bacterium]
MEEYVGELWHKLVTGAAEREYPQAAVALNQMEKTIGVMFRALGGDSGLAIGAAAEARHGARRRWLQRIAGSGEKTTQASLDDHGLHLPPRIALFADEALNRDLYLWLAALAAHDMGSSGDWLLDNQRATVITLALWPGLEARYRRLVEACIAQRLPLERLPRTEAAREAAIRAALHEPGSVAALPPGKRPVQPVPLWLYASPNATRKARALQHQEAGGDGGPPEDGERKRHRAEQTDMPEQKHGMLMIFRAESLLSWAEYVKVNRSLDDDEDPSASRAAENMDQLSVAQDGERVASKLRFDLDLPPAGEDDQLVGEGLPLPEWDYRTQQLRPDYCRLQYMAARQAEPTPLPERLRRPAQRLRGQFAALAPQRRWLKGQPDGPEQDIDAFVRLHADRQAGHTEAAGLYLAQAQRERDLSCLVLADLSLSTDAWISNEQRVVDVVRDSLMLFAEALGATGDRFALYGFSSLKRGQVRFHEMKSFAARYDDAARGRIAAIRPGYYTRMGAAIRQSTKLLEKEPAGQRLLLILSDGKPHDLDLYEGRYGVEDTRMAVSEARRAGLKPFCVTIDREGAAYLPHLFGPAGYTVVRKPEELPKRLPLLYAQLTGR